MQRQHIEHNGRLYLVSHVHGMHWSFTAYGETHLHLADMDLQHEFGEDQVAWAQYIDDVFLEAGLIFVDDGEYVPSATQRMQVMGRRHPDWRPDYC